MARRLMRMASVALTAFVLSALPAAAVSPPATDTLSVTVDRSGPVAEYRLPRADLLPSGVAPDREGRVWITFEEASTPSQQGAAGTEATKANRKQVGLLDPDQGTIAYLPAPLVPFLPRVAPDGALWLTESSPEGGKSAAGTPARLARRDPASGEWKVFTTPEKSRGTAMVAFDAAGNTWFSELDSGRVGRVDQTGAVEEFTLPEGSLALGISIDKDGKVWTTGTVLGNTSGAAGKILRLDPERGKVDRFGITQGYFATDLVTDARGVWVTGLGRAMVALLDPQSGNISWWDTRTTETDSKTVRAKGIVPDSRGHIWVAEPEADQISRVIPDKQIVMEYAVPGKDLGIQWLAADARDNIWFGVPGARSVGRIAADAPVWTLDPGWAAVGVPAGGQAQGKLRVTNEGKEDGRLTLSTVDAPEGITVAFRPATITVKAGKSAEVAYTLKVDGKVRENRYSFRFVARGDGVAASRAAEIQVVPAGSRPATDQGGAPSLVAVGAGVAAGALLVAFLLRLGAVRRPK